MGEEGKSLRSKTAERTSGATYNFWLYFSQSSQRGPGSTLCLVHPPQSKGYQEQTLTQDGDLWATYSWVSQLSQRTNVPSLPQCSIPLCKLLLAPGQCVPPRRAQLPILLVYAAFSTHSLTQCLCLSHPWHRVLHLPLLNFVIFVSAHFFSRHILLLHQYQPGTILLRDRNARQETWGL